MFNNVFECSFIKYDLCWFVCCIEGIIYFFYMLKVCIYMLIDLYFIFKCKWVGFFLMRKGYNYYCVYIGFNWFYINIGIVILKMYKIRLFSIYI